MGNLGKLIAAALMLGLTGTAWASCDSLKSELDAKIRKNGVEKFTLTIVPADAKDVDGKVIGHCEGNTKQIVYKRG
ncbi:MAG TPA: DUF1161 domain-containing protein [Burkholderiales bacterium]|nr:DUF1161 domain-containing protein [Burkholderiales bacterium]